MLNGARKNLSNLVLNIVTYLWDTTLEVVSKLRCGETPSILRLAPTGQKYNCDNMHLYSPSPENPVPLQLDCEESHYL
jgi:hypothetical protein